MADARKLAFAAFAPPSKGVLVVFCEEGLKFGPGDPQGAGRRPVIWCSGRPRPTSSPARAAAPSTLWRRRACRSSRLVVMGVGKAGKLKAQDFVKLGGAALGKVPARAEAGDDLRRTSPAAR